MSASGPTTYTPLDDIGGSDRAEIPDSIYRAAVLTNILTSDDAWVHVEHSSTYGAALMFPQVARSAGWPISLTIMALRSFMFLFFGMSLQIYLLNQVGREERVMSGFAGQMHLCNFAPGARGPLGTIITPERTYSFGQWATRLFARDSVKTLFPSRAEEIDSSVDVGEYALQSFQIRWVCCAVFMMVTLEELLRIYHLFTLLWSVPCEAGVWIDGDKDSKEHDSWLERVHLQVAGIPRHWKAIYFVALLLPKIMIWKLCCQAGIEYLMETADIDGTLVNCVALAFILNLDENVCETMMTEHTRVMMSKCTGYPLHDRESKKLMKTSQLIIAASDLEGVSSGRRTKAEVATEYLRQESLSRVTFRDVIQWLPGKLFLIGFLTMCFVADYYSKNCEFSQDGKLVSKPMYYPKSTTMNFLEEILPNLFNVEVEGEPYWTMPEQ
mmetsp:Transcript_1156/g.2896  ORF Transcript_1156/g.2896 Transcript_1156/m.2896 type:complete len:440 (+) Transcript_1156:126-1445(+)